MGSCIDIDIDVDTDIDIAMDSTSYRLGKQSLQEAPAAYSYAFFIFFHRRSRNKEAAGEWKCGLVDRWWVMKVDSSTYKIMEYNYRCGHRWV